MMPQTVQQVWCVRCTDPHGDYYYHEYVNEHVATIHKASYMPEVNPVVVRAEKVVTFQEPWP